MKKILFLSAIVLMLAACGQKDNKEQEQSEQKKVYIPPMVPKAPVQQIPSQTMGLEFNQSSGGNGPVLQVEEGKPLDLSQLMGGRKSLQDQIIERIDSIRILADEGKPEYQYLYGVCHENGWGVEQSEKEAFAWYSKSAEQEYPSAYNSLGNFYRSGTAVKSDINKAFEMYQKGAEGKDAQAMLNLGNCYFYGMGVNKDEQTAVKWWKDAAEAGNAYANSQMGDCYYYGIGVEKNLEKAVEYYTIAADKNVSNAQYMLGILYYNGQGVQQDRVHTKLLMKKASDGGMKEAQDFLDKYFKE